MARVYYIDKDDLQETLATLCITQLTDPVEPVLFNQTILAAMVPGIRRGDCLCLAKNKENRYRNEGITLYDGTAFIELDGTHDEYGHVPASFEVTDSEFAPDYWADAISHNTYFFPSSTIRERAVAAITYGPLPGFTTLIHSSTFKIGTTTYTLLLDDISFGLEEHPEQAVIVFREKIVSVPWIYGLGSCNLDVDMDVVDASRCLLIA